MLNRAIFRTISKVPIFDGKILPVLIVLIYGTIEKFRLLLTTHTRMQKRIDNCNSNFYFFNVFSPYLCNVKRYKQRLTVH